MDVFIHFSKNMKNLDTPKAIAIKGKNIEDYDTGYSGKLTKQMGIAEMEKIKLKIDALQEKLYAEDSQSLLIIFQAMDAAGKDSAIAHIMSGLNPQGCEVYSFKTPNTEELSHDFIWRHYKALPQRGKIGIHNRSHYENVLVCKVHPEYVLNEHIPGIDEVKKIKKEFWHDRYESIRNFEKHVSKNGTTILKFFLNISKEEQKERLLDRIEETEKHWKFSAGDLKERALWDDYMKAYATVFDETSTRESPWFVIPADRKWYARLLVSQIILETLEKMNPQFPNLSKEDTEGLDACKKQLLAEK